MVASQDGQFANYKQVKIGDHFADFEQVKIDGYFVNFEQVKTVVQSSTV